MGSHEERGEKGHEVHVVVVPCPTQGHINPLLQLSKHLAHRGLKVTLPAIVTNSTNNLTVFSSLTIDQVHLLPYQGTEPEDAYGLWERRQTSIRLHLTELLARYETAGDPVACVVYDSMIPWVLDIVKKFGVMGASFFTQSSAVNAVYYNIHKGWLDVPLQQSSVALDGFPVLQTSDLSSFVSDPTKHPSIIGFMSEQFARLGDADWILVNTFDSLEPEEAEWMGKQFPFKSIGPMLPSIYLDGRLPDDRDYGLSLFESTMDYSAMNWLDSKDTSSVVYVSFGSLAEVGKEQMEELAWGLKLSSRFFLWVVRESEIQKLPSNFMEETSEKRLVVKWCPQLEVLSHRSVGCFITHCGWNSTLEALSLGVPLVAMAQWSDQPTNAKYVEDVWKIGKRVRVEEDGVARREEIEVCINEVMEGEDSKQIRENLRKWRELAKEAMDEGGSSDRNIDHFVEQLLRKA